MIAVIAEMAAGRIDAIAFTSAPKVRRFRDVGRAFGREAELRQGLERIVVAAVGLLLSPSLMRLECSECYATNKFFMSVTSGCIKEK